MPEVVLNIAHKKRFGRWIHVNLNAICPPILLITWHYSLLFITADLKLALGPLHLQTLL